MLVTPRLCCNSLEIEQSPDYFSLYSLSITSPIEVFLGILFQPSLCKSVYPLFSLTLELIPIRRSTHFPSFLSLTTVKASLKTVALLHGCTHTVSIKADMQRDNEMEQRISIIPVPKMK